MHLAGSMPEIRRRRVAPLTRETVAMTDFEAAVDHALSGTGDTVDSAEVAEWGNGDDELQSEYGSTGDVSDWELESSSLAGWSSESGGDWEAEFAFEGAPDWIDEDGELAFEADYETSGGGGLLSEAEIDELARDLMGVASTQEMEAFLGKIFGGIKKKIKRSLGGGLAGRILKAGSGLIGRALPVVGASLGTAMLPGIGTGLGGAIGSQIRGLFSGRAGRSLGKSLTRTALRSARRAGLRNPLQSLLARGGAPAIRSLFGFEMETGADDPQYEVARRVVRTVADAADIASRVNVDNDSAVWSAYRKAAERHLPMAVRAAMISSPVPR